MSRKLRVPAVVLRGFGMLVSMIVGGVLVRADSVRPPTMQLETGMHTATITSMAVDALGHYLVTGSQDKSVRVWDLQAYKLTQTLRPLRGPQHVGEVVAVAISPDSALLAVAYRTAPMDASPHVIELIDRVGGQSRGRLAVLPAPVSRLVFSADAQLLAAAMDRGGTRIFSVLRRTPLGGDGCTGTSTGVDFDQHGRLVTTCDDRQIRLFGTAGNLQQRVTAREKSQASRYFKGQLWPNQIPAGIRFSPDGSKLALNYLGEGQLVMETLSGKTLDAQWVVERHTANDSQPLHRVNWTPDGKTVIGMDLTGHLAAWEAEAGGAPIRLPPQRHRGDYLTSGFLISPQGGVVENGSASPDRGAALRVYGPRGSLLFDQKFVPAFPRDRALFWLQNDGKLLFMPNATGNDPERNLLFSPEHGSLTELPVPSNLELDDHGGDYEYISARRTSLRPVPPGYEAVERAHRPKLAIEITQEKAFLNDRPLPLDAGEGALGWNAAPDDQSFVIRTDQALHRFDASGTRRWTIPLQSVPWRVKVSGDGQLLIVFSAEGTFRWYTYADGKERLAFYYHHDGRWVAWTPQGYYTASVDGERFLGIQQERDGSRLGDFFSVAQLRQRLFSPSAIAKALHRSGGTISPAAPLALAQELPPIARILSPTEGAELTEKKLTVELALRSPSGAAIRSVSLLINGRETRGVVDLTEAYQPTSAQTTPEPPLFPGESRRSLVIDVPDEDFLLSALAKTDQTVSEPASVQLRRRASGRSREVAIRPNLYILAVGVGSYKREGLRLRFPAKDAGDFVAALKGQEGKLYEKVVAHVLRDQQATKDNILSEIEWLRRESTAYSVTMLFLAGHGITDPGSSRYYFLPVDADPNQILRTMLSEQDIRIVSSLPGKVLMFLDTCYAGRVFGDRQLRGAGDLSRLINELASADNGLVVFTSSTKQQSSQESAVWQNGAFTKALVEGLRGRAVYGETIPGKPKSVTINGLGLFISERVKELTEGLQAPAMARPETIPDFPIAVLP